MRRYTAVLIGLMLFGGCGGEVKTAAAPVAAQADVDDAASTDIGGRCGFADDLPTAEDATTLDAATIDKIVDGSPGEIRDDVRLVMETSVRAMALTKEFEGLTDEQKAARAGELSQFYTAEYVAAAQAVTAYITENCPEFAGAFGTPGS